jgi:hypothetical protein
LRKRDQADEKAAGDASDRRGEVDIGLRGGHRAIGGFLVLILRSQGWAGSSVLFL